MLSILTLETNFGTSVYELFTRNSHINYTQVKKI